MYMFQKKSFRKTLSNALVYSEKTLVVQYTGNQETNASFFKLRNPYK